MGSGYIEHAMMCVEKRRDKDTGKSEQKSDENSEMRWEEIRFGGEVGINAFQVSA